MGIVSKETVVLRQWRIVKQELSLSSEALIILLKFYHHIKFEKHELTFQALALHSNKDSMLNTSAHIFKLSMVVTFK